MGSRCSECSIECCSERFTETKPDSGAWAKVYHKMLGNRTIRNAVRDDGHGDIGWLLVALVLEAKRIEHSHGVLCDHGRRLGVSDFVDACALPHDVVAKNLERLIASETILEIDGAYVLSGFDRLQYSRATLWRRSKTVSLKRSVNVSKIQEAEAEAEAEAGPKIVTPSESAPAAPVKKAKDRPAEFANLPDNAIATARKLVKDGRAPASLPSDCLSLYNHWASSARSATGEPTPAPANTLPPDATQRRYTSKAFHSCVFGLLGLGYSTDQLARAIDGYMSDMDQVAKWGAHWSSILWDEASLTRCLAKCPTSQPAKKRYFNPETL